VNRRHVYCGHGRGRYHRFQIQSDSAQMVQVPLATPSISTSKGRMRPRA
jgi:hypothetical protein